MNIKDFAKALKVSHQTVYNWKLGVTKPRIDKLKKISELLKVDLHKLLAEFYK